MASAKYPSPAADATIATISPAMEAPTTNICLTSFIACPWIDPLQAYVTANFPKNNFPATRCSGSTKIGLQRAMEVVESLAKNVEHD
jgi:hypothetical protein